MTVKLDREFVVNGVREDIAACLAIEPEEIELHHNFFHDLGGESIDLLDLGFRSERRYGIRSPFSRLTDPDSWRIEEDGKLAMGSVQRLEAEFPRIDWKTHLNAVEIRRYQDLLTIRLIVDLMYDAQFDQPVTSPASPAIESADRT